MCTWVSNSFFMEKELSGLVDIDSSQRMNLPLVNLSITLIDLDFMNIFLYYLAIRSFRTNGPCCAITPPFHRQDHKKTQRPYRFPFLLRLLCEKPCEMVRGT
jgi:hypothetical protein